MENDGNEFETIGEGTGNVRYVESIAAQLLMLFPGLLERSQQRKRSPAPVASPSSYGIPPSKLLISSLIR